MFGYNHGLLVATKFYEHLRDEERKNIALQFKLGTGDEMLIPCLYSHWEDPKGEEPDLWSFDFITDDPSDQASLYAIFDDRARPYCEHEKVA